MFIQILIQEPLKERKKFQVQDNTKQKIASYANHQAIQFRNSRNRAASISVGTIVMLRYLVPVITVRKLALNERQSTQWDRRVHNQEIKSNLLFQDLEIIT